MGVQEATRLRPVVIAAVRVDVVAFSPFVGLVVVPGLFVPPCLILGIGAKFPTVVCPVGPCGGVHQQPPFEDSQRRPAKRSAMSTSMGMVAPIAPVNVFAPSPVLWAENSKALSTTDSSPAMQT